VLVEELDRQADQVVEVDALVGAQGLVVVAVEQRGGRRDLVVGRWAASSG
jgi:hypothetical protein